MRTTSRQIDPAPQFTSESHCMKHWKVESSVAERQTPANDPTDGQSKSSAHPVVHIEPLDESVTTGMHDVGLAHEVDVPQARYCGTMHRGSDGFAAQKVAEHEASAAASPGHPTSSPPAEHALLGVREMQPS